MLAGAHPQTARITRKHDGVEQVLILIDDYNVNGDYLSSAAPWASTSMGKPCVDFSLQQPRAPTNSAT